MLVCVLHDEFTGLLDLLVAFFFVLAREGLVIVLEDRVGIDGIFEDVQFGGRVLLLGEAKKID